MVVRAVVEAVYTLFFLYLQYLFQTEKIALLRKRCKMNIPVAIYSMFLLLLDTLLLGIQVDIEAFFKHVSSITGHPASWHTGRP
jgi:hypothetical protein